VRESIPLLPFDCGYALVIGSAVVLVDDVEELAAELEPAESHLDGAVARKNLSLSRCASRSCSNGLRGRIRPPERPGVEPV
jgi:hypothetical protein